MPKAIEIPSINDALRIPMFDLRAVDLVFPKHGKNVIRCLHSEGAIESLRYWDQYRQIESLTEDPHAYCEHDRGICYRKWGQATLAAIT